MKITADTNVLVRALTEDDRLQSAIARAELEQAETVMVTTTALCELVWVLPQGYRQRSGMIAEPIRRLTDADNVAVDRGAVDAGLAQLDDGGDFADGVIAQEGYRLGASTFVSFDHKAVRLLEKRGEPVRVLRSGSHAPRMQECLFFGCSDETTGAGSATNLMIS